jgi:Rrf2 family protein
MFKINRRTDYAVRVGVALALRPASSRVPTQAIQAEMLIPRPFLQRIIAELCRARLLQTYPGPNGGIQLARPAGQITLKDIVIAMEGKICVSDCLTAQQSCPLSCDCPVRLRWGRLQSTLLNELSKTTLLDLAREAAESPVQPRDGSAEINSLLPAGLDAQPCRNPTF